MSLENIVSAARHNIEAGQPLSADVAYRMVLAETEPPKNGLARVARGEACVFMAQRALARGKHGEAGDWYREALDADPRAGDYRADYIIKVLLPMGLKGAALIEAERAVRIDPKNARCWRALGGVHHDQGNSDGAIAAREQALEIAPGEPLVWLDMAATCIDTQDYRRVEEIAKTIIERWPNHHGDAAHLLAMVAYREGRHEEALALFDRAIESGCFDVSMARWNQSLAFQSLGLYKEGWALYEARGDQTTDPIFAMVKKRFDRPQWNNEPPPARIHLHAEMGHGDTIAMARFAPLLASRGYDVRLEANASMVSLLRHSFPNVNVVEKALNYPRSLGLEDFDYHLPLLSCPAALGVEIDTVPWDGPYFAAAPEWVSHWSKKLGAPIRKRVGLCWSSGIRDGIWLGEYGRRKSMRFDQLAPLFSNDIEFLSLQCGPPAGENQILPGLDRNDPDWAETAGLIENLDLIITVDSAVAHLAGAMDKPVWVMMHTEGSWHWMVARAWGGRCETESPWYPSARLFRQKKAHEWGAVIAAVNTALGKFINSE